MAVATTILLLVAASSASAYVGLDRPVLELPQVGAGSTAMWNATSAQLQSRQASAPGATAPSFDTGTALVDGTPAASNVCAGQKNGGTSGNSSTIGDVNGDGLGDILFGCLGDDTGASGAGSVVVITRNAANDGWSTAVELYDPNPTTNEDCGSAIAVVDLDNDGTNDVVMGCPNAGTTGQVVTFQSNGGNPVTFETGVEITIAGAVDCGNSLAATDTNADGFMDLAVGCYNDDARVLTSDGAPGGDAVTWSAPVTLPNGGRPQCGYGIATGDFNDDGLGDVVVPCSHNITASEQQVQVFMSNGGTPVTFQPYIEYAPATPGTGDSCRAAAAGDVNGDGLTDLITGCSQGSWAFTYGEGYINVYTSNGGTPSTTSFDAPIKLLQSGTVVDYCGYQVAAPDIDADGYADIVSGCGVSNQSVPGRLVYWMSNGGATPTFDASVPLVDPAPASADRCGLSVATGDIDADGMADVAMGCPGDDTGFSDAGNSIVFTNTTSVAFGASQVLSTRRLNRVIGTVNYATLTASSRLNGQSVGWEMTANGGTNWYPVTPGVQFDFPVSGTDLRARATFASASNLTAVVHDMTVRYGDNVNVNPVAVPLLPASASWTADQTPDVRARHTDGDLETGTLTFEFCGTNAADPWSSTCGSSYQTASSPSGLAHLTGYWTTVPSALPEGTMYWRVRSRDQSLNYGPWSTPWSIQVDLTPSTVPTNLGVTSTSTTSVDVSWDAATDSGSGGIVYDVQSAPDGSSWSDVAACQDIAATTCSATGLPASATVHLRVRSCDAVGNCSAWQTRIGSTSPPSGVHYLRSTLSSTFLTGAPNRLATGTSGTMNAGTTVLHSNGAAAWYPIRPAVTGSTTSVGATEPPDVMYNDPTGTGWVVDATAGKTILAGDASVTFRVVDTNGTGTGRIQCRLYRATTSGGTASPTPTFIGKSLMTSDVLSTTAATRTCPAIPIASPLTLAANEVIYVELWLQVTAIGGSGASMSIETEGATSYVTLPGIANGPPMSPTPTAPADAGSTDLAPTLEATYNHSSGDTGFIEFEVATSSGFGGTIVASGTSSSVADGQTGSLALGGLIDGTTYYWRARGVVGSNGLQSPWSSTWSFTAQSGGGSISIVVDTNDLDLGTVTADVDHFASFTATVTTTNPNGYNLTAIGSATGTNGAACGGCATPLDDWTGTGGTPTAWGANAAGANGRAGITVRDALGTRLAKWGTGTGTAENDVTNNLYAGLDSLTPIVLHNRASAAAGGDPVVITWRETASLTTSATTHTETITLTATTNP